MLGAEYLHLQSLWFDDAILGRHSNQLLTSLAGNAFEVSCFGAVMLTGLRGHSRGRARPALCSSLSQPANGSDSEEEDSLVALWGPRDA